VSDELDLWLSYYNTERPHSGRYCYGKTPVQAFQDSRELAKSKDLNDVFARSNNFIAPHQAEAGAAGEQPARNNVAVGNESASGTTRMLLLKIILSHCLLKRTPVRLSSSDYILSRCNARRKGNRMM
jgi:hypothetical protein